MRFSIILSTGTDTVTLFFAAAVRLGRIRSTGVYRGRTLGGRLYCSLGCSLDSLGRLCCSCRVSGSKSIIVAYAAAIIDTLIIRSYICTIVSSGLAVSLTATLVIASVFTLSLASIPAPVFASVFPPILTSVFPPILASVSASSAHTAILIPSTHI